MNPHKFHKMGIKHLAYSPVLPHIVCFCTVLLAESPRFKKIGKIRVGYKLSLALIYGLSFRIQAASNLSSKTGLIFYLADFHGRNWPIPDFYMRTRLNIEPYSPLKPTQVGFFYSLSRAENLAAVNCVTQAVVRVGSKIGS